MTPMTQARASDMLPKQISGPLTDSNANKVTSLQNSTASLRVVFDLSAFSNTMYCKLVHKFGRNGSILCSDWLGSVGDTTESPVSPETHK
jgi:predicted helicase